MTAKEFILNMPNKINPEAMEGKGDTVFHFKVSGDGGGEFTAKAENGEFSVVEGLEGEAKCVITTSDKILSEILEKKRNPQMAVFTGKLKISNLGEMMKYAKPLGLM
ncbi:MAG: SCP2 sterol-binding domain-containing protein [Aureispira sp.]|nr:SCP2 sterol-binding domain-containing protein [Aureispira sp.]